MENVIQTEITPLCDLKNFDEAINFPLENTLKLPVVSIL